MKLQLRFTGGRLTHLSSAIVETLSHHWVYPVQTSLSNIFEGNTLTVKFFLPQYLKCPAREPNMSSASVYPKGVQLFLFPLSLLRGITLFSELLWLSRAIANFIFFRVGGSGILTERLIRSDITKIYCQQQKKCMLLAPGKSSVSNWKEVIKAGCCGSQGSWLFWHEEDIPNYTIPNCRKSSFIFSQLLSYFLCRLEMVCLFSFMTTCSGDLDISRKTMWFSSCGSSPHADASVERRILEP